MKKPIKFVLLQTEDETLFVVKNNKKQTLLVIPRDKKHRSNLLMGLNYVNKHLYATVSQDIEPIKKGDWCLLFDDYGTVMSQPQQWLGKGILNNGLQKIIATTDPKFTHPSKVQYGNMTMVDHNEDGSWYHAINVEVEFSLSRKELTRRGVIIPQIPQSTIKEFTVNPMGEFEVEYVYDVDILEEYNKEVDYTGSSCIDLKDGLELKLNQDNTVNITSVE